MNKYRVQFNQFRWKGNLIDEYVEADNKESAVQAIVDRVIGRFIMFDNDHFEGRKRSRMWKYVNDMEKDVQVERLKMFPDGGTY